MARTVIVGDVHGCRVELESLLAAVNFTRHDRLVFVGDLVARGPDSSGVLELAQQLGAQAVRGNHEDKLLRSRDGSVRLGREHAEMAQKLSARQWGWIERLPLLLMLGDHDACVVHAGVLPGRPIESTPPEALLTMRAIDSRGHWSDQKGARPLWGEHYTGPPHIVFGHNALSQPQFHSWATGIDTGCVYGGRLTALVLEERERVPRGEGVGDKLTSVAARRPYYGAHGRPPSR
jgi:hypothetical protein